MPYLFAYLPRDGKPLFISKEQFTTRGEAFAELLKLDKYTVRRWSIFDVTVLKGWTLGMSPEEYLKDNRIHFKRDDPHFYKPIREKGIVVKVPDWGRRYVPFFLDDFDPNKDALYASFPYDRKYLHWRYKFDEITPLGFYIQTYNDEGHPQPCKIFVEII